MSEPVNLFKLLRWKVVASVIAATGLYFGSEALEFPLVFRLMFVFYAFLGFAVFVLLDLPPMPPMQGVKAAVLLIAFYIVVSAVFTGVGIALPQYDPEWEKGKIQKILDAKRSASPELTKDELAQRAQQLQAQAEGLLERVASLEKVVTGKVSAPSAADIKVARAAIDPNLDPVAYGAEVYDLYECYNCHKIGGKGGTKKRGPKLDNLGNVATAENLKKKIFEPKSFMSEGFEKEFKKELMPDNYPDLMSDLELDSLVKYLMTLQDAKVDTPKMIPQ